MKRYCRVCGLPLVPYTPIGGSDPNYLWMACPKYANRWRRILFGTGSEHGLEIVGMRQDAFDVYTGKART